MFRRSRPPAELRMIVIVCAWCGRELRNIEPAGTPITSHGMCAFCAEQSGVFPVEELLAMTRDEYDQLPIGIIELDAAGVVRGYNRAEERLSGMTHDRFMGRDFFREVAPCTAVQEFEGQYREMVGLPEVSDREFTFVFRFEAGARLMMIHLIFDPVRERGVVAVKALA
jgi:photoactive yellow protein